MTQSIPVRVVKGQWSQASAEPAPDPATGFMALIAVLAGSRARISVASHDVDLAEQALRCLTAAGTPCELELLYGLPSRRSRKMAERLHVPVRFYVPFGSAHLPYVIGKAIERPYLISWLLRDRA